VTWGCFSSIFAINLFSLFICFFLNLISFSHFLSVNPYLSAQFV
jgi:hypothetical protein